MSVALHNEFSTDLNRYMSELGQSARAAAAVLAYAQPEQKNQALLEIATVLDQRRDFILQENRKDLDAAALVMSQAIDVLVDEQCEDSKVRHIAFSKLSRERLREASSLVKE
jgi:gamma-glutamyl phosphate reductase